MLTLSRAKTILASGPILASGLILALGLAATAWAGAPVASPVPVQIHGTFITDVTDARRLVGAVDDVFIGRVIAQVGTRSLSEGLPETQFQVEVEEVIKGRLAGRVTVNQLGELDGGRLVLLEDDAPLQPGRVYLFATRLHPGVGWHTVVPGHGDLLIADAQQRGDLTAKFRQAARDEIRYDPNE